jgi:putative FmdB family regulatory protein
MPLYEYQCEACGVVGEELIRRASDEESLCCRGCGEKRLKKLLSRPAAYSFGVYSEEGCSAGECPGPGPQGGCGLLGGRCLG